MPIIAEESIRQVLSATDIVDLIQQYVPLKKAGVGNHKGLCPFHPEKTPSFNVSATRQSFHCFGCGKGGDAITFVREHLNLPFLDAVRHLAKRVNITLIEEATDPNSEKNFQARSRVIKVNNDVAKWMHDLLTKLRGPGPDAARDYLKNRGLGKDVASRWLIGYAPDDIRLWREWGRTKNIKDVDFIEAGLFIPKVEGDPKQGGYVRFRHRIMFPVRNEHGDVLAFSGRLLDASQKGGKYINSPETAVFNKSQVFFGWDKTNRAVRKAETVIICEGQIDLITAFEHGVENVVAPLGTAFTEHHARMLRRSASTAILCFDADNAGFNAALKCYRMLSPEGMLVKVATLPKGEDPDSMIRKQGPEAFREYIDNARDFFDFQIDLHPEALDPNKTLERSRLAGDLAENIGLLKDKVIQDAAINRCAFRLNLPIGDLRVLVNREIQKRQREDANRRTQEANRQQAAAKADLQAPSASGSPAEPTPIVRGVEIESWPLRHLIRMALTDVDSFNWLHEQAASGELPWKIHAGGECLERILQASFTPGDAAAISALLATFPDEHRGLLSKILVERAPKDDLSGTESAFLLLKIESCQKQQDLITQKLRSGPDAEEMVRLMSELQRLKNEAAAVRKRIPPPRLQSV